MGAGLGTDRRKPSPADAGDRCPEEFERLFLARYAATYGDGLQLKPVKTLHPLEFVPASASFGEVARPACAKSLCDVQYRYDHQVRLAKLFDSVADELSDYSRHLARHASHDSLRALALLPAPLARDRAPDAFIDLCSELPAEGHAVVSATRITALHSDTPTSQLLLKRDAETITSLLAALGVGLEPDPRLGNGNFSSHRQVVLWRDDTAAAPAGENFAAAAVLLHLYVLACRECGDSPKRIHQLAAIFTLPPAGQRRLQAYMHWLLAEQPARTGLKLRIRHLEDGSCKLIARSLLEAAITEDFPASAAQLEALRQISALVDLDNSDPMGCF